MTAAAEANHLRPIHPLGPGGIAEPHSALHGSAPLPTPEAAQPGMAAAPVMRGVATPQPADRAPFPGAHIGAAWRLPARTYAKGDRLYETDAPAEAVFIVEAGLVALELDTPRPRIVELAGPGDVIGALAPGHGRYLENATALSGEVAVRVLDERAQAELAAPELATLLLSAAGARIATLTHALEDGEHPVPARVARAFLRLGSRFGQELSGGAVRLTLPITHDTIAAMVGAARETTTAVVAELRQRGLVDGTRGHYRIRPAELAGFAHEAALAAGS